MRTPQLFNISEAGRIQHAIIRVLSCLTGFVQVPESPGILLWHFPGLSSPGKRPLVLESFGNLFNLAKKYEGWGGGGGGEGSKEN